MANDGVPHAERAMSAPPEVVFNTAIDPDRLAAWLPEPLLDGTDRRAERRDGLRARWSRSGWTADLAVEGEPAGGSRVRLELRADPPGDRLAEIADESLASLASEVADNFTAG